MRFVTVEVVGGKREVDLPDGLLILFGRGPDEGVHAEARERDDGAHERGGHARDRLHDGIDVAVAGEEAAVAEADGAEHEPGRQVSEKAELGPEALVGQGGHMGHPEPERQNEEERRTGHDGEGGAPRERPREEAAERHADEVGDRHARDHQADVSRGLAGRRETGRHDGAHAEVGAVRKARDESCGEHRPVVEGEGREEVSREDQARQEVEHARERDAACSDHHDGDARTHAEREGEKVSGHVAAFLAGVRAPCLWCVCCID